MPMHPAPRPSVRRALLHSGALALCILLSGCATLQQFAALQRVAFSLDGAANGTLAGVSIEQIQQYDQLRATDIARLGASLATGALPFETDLLVGALNPEDNVEARLVELEWTLFLDERETVRGRWDEERLLPPGQSTTIPVRVSLDLFEFFDGTLPELVELALAVAGAGEPRRVHLEALPTIQTPLGPIRYPQPIRIDYEVGGPGG